MSAARTRRSGRASAAVLIAVVLVLLSAPVHTAPAGATTESSTSSGVELLAAPAASGLVLDGRPLSIRVTLTNDSAVSTGALRIEMRSPNTLPATQQELTEWFSESHSIATADTGELLAESTISALDPGASAVLDLTIESDATTLFAGFGPRLLTVSAIDLARGAIVSTDRTAAVFAPGEATPVTAAVFVLPFTIPNDASPIFSAEVLAEESAVTGSLSRALEAAAGRPVLLAIDPRVIASVRLLGDAAPPSTLELLDRLAAIPNETMMLPWADADPLATVIADGVTLPEPEGAGVPRSGESPATAQPSATEPPETEVSTVPVAELIALPTTLDRAAWVEYSSVPLEALTTLESSGIDYLFMSSSAVDSPQPIQRNAGLRVVQTNAPLTAAVREASSAPTQQRFARAMARASALLAARAAEDTQSTAIIGLGRLPATANDRLLEAITQTLSLPWATGGQLARVLAEPAAPLVLRPHVTDDRRGEAVAAALSAEAADRRFAEIAITPSLIADQRRLELLVALSQQWGVGATAQLEAFVADSVRLRSTVQVVESSAITLLADRASLPVTVQNDLDVAVRAYVNVDPDTAQLRVLDPAVEVIIEPRSQARALVPVESLTNGETAITVTVRDADATVLSTPTRVVLNLQAGWETAGSIVVLAGVLALLIAGIVRDLRKRRSPSEGAE